ncbi:3-phosphoinositide dependent protein kinase-1 [Rhizophlyctis rosea]|nr:3-phosphoinositide dependent protein kinase-1 [Rhizophlyctis rosea]
MADEGKAGGVSAESSAGAGRSGPEWQQYRDTVEIPDEEEAPVSTKPPQKPAEPPITPSRPAAASSRSSPRSAKKLTPTEQKEADPSLNIIPDNTMESIVHYIETMGVKNIIVMTGAGISTSAGIPDFRSPGTGLYDNLAKYNLPYPQAIFDINYFRRKPEPFFTLASELYPGNFQPTPSHYFIRLLAEKGILLRNYTQNIDTLERVAGMPADLLVEAHGSFSDAHCVGAAAPGDDASDSEDEMAGTLNAIRGCGKEYSQKWVKDEIFAGRIPRCEQCNGLVKPDIVFFGESLPERFHTLLRNDFRVCDLLIVIGTSLQVMPFAALINHVQEHVPRLLINRELAGVTESAHSGFDFDGSLQKYRRDAVFLGGCDEGCERLADLLGWKEELTDLIRREKIRLKTSEESPAPLSTEAATTTPAATSAPARSPTPAPETPAPSISATSPPTVAPVESVSPPPDTRKRVRADFEFGRTLGEGSYSTVLFAREKGTDREFAVKMLDKRHIIKEKKVKYVNVEKDVLNALSHPGIIKLYYTFQDQHSLYFVLELAKDGDLLGVIRKLGCFDAEGARWYIAEIIDAVAYLHSQGVIHRDLKPENLLLDSNMHIKIADFGTAKQKKKNDEPSDDDADTQRNSFVGTAEYCSPELLNDRAATEGSDVWAIGCILFQLLAGKPPFRGSNDYQTFQKIIKLEYAFPEGFNETAADLIRQILVLEPSQRLTLDQIKKHAFFDGFDWKDLQSRPPPDLRPFLPATSDHNIEDLRSELEVLNLPYADGAGLYAIGDTELPARDPFETDEPSLGTGDRAQAAIDPKRAEQLQRQAASWFASFLKHNELILMDGPVNKRKGLFSTKRGLLLTDLPRLVFYDEGKQTLKTEIPWSEDLKVELKGRKHFFIHTSKRTWYLEDLEGNAARWVDKISELIYKVGSS